MLDFRLETFLSVCETMNYRKSAELLHITQPAVTQHIHHLEKSYHCKLFQYEGRRLKKTRAATILEQYARTMKVNECNMMRQLENSEISELNIGVTKTIAQCIISKYVERFIKHEDKELSLIEDNTEHLLRLIDECKLDFALIEGIFEKHKYGHMLFSKELFVGVCAPTHPFANRAVTVSELLEETLICRENGSGTRAILENKLLDFNESITHFKRCICISSFPIILDYVKKGLGISFVYEVLAKQSGLSTFTIQGCQIQREFNFVYPKNTGAEEKIQYFMEGRHVPA